MHILVDGDILVYKVAFSMEVPVYVVKNKVFARKHYAKLHSEKTGFPISKRMNIGHAGELNRKLKAEMDKIFEGTSCRQYTMYLTGTTNFRHQAATILEYKGNRKNVAKPIHYRRMREVMVKNWGAIIVDGEETDDALAAHQHNSTINPHDPETANYENTIIASIDKDMLQIPGYHYDLNSQIITMVTPDEAIKNFLMQLLQGDTTDNIPGLIKLMKIKGFETEAKSLAHHSYLKKFQSFCVDKDIKSCYNYIVDLYKQYGTTDKEIEEIFNLLWLRRYPNQNGYKSFHREYIEDKIL